MEAETLLSVEDLEVTFRTREETFTVLNGISFNVARERTLGLVGESGCGKSMTARAVLQILPPQASITRGSIVLEPGGRCVELARLHPHSKALRRVRGGEVGMIFQEPMASFSPVHTIGQQACEAVRLHLGLSRAEARRHVIEMLRMVSIPTPESRIDAYPHQLSGGLRQRAMIAIALSCRPKLLIADEPTTALDVTVQAQIIDLLRRLQAELGMALLMITHDLSVIAETADDVAVMYCGRIVEQAPTPVLFRNPKHPYTRGLLRSVAPIGLGNQHRLEAIPGAVPSPLAAPAGCPFHPRCPERIDGLCDVGPAPALTPLTVGHAVACHLYPSAPVTPAVAASEATR